MSKMIVPCECCGKRPGHHWHHKFHRHKNRLETYGKHLIDHPLNSARLCPECHEKHKDKYHHNEMEFRETLGLFRYCKGRINCFMQNFPFFDENEDADECYYCRDFVFDKDRYYQEKGIKENQLIPGSYRYKE